MTLLQFATKSGLFSRRKAFDAIQQGLITVNHYPIENPLYELKETDRVFFEKKQLILQEFTYILFHKPKGCVTSKQDPSSRSIIFDYLPKELHSLDPIGRLDLNTSGALLLTNDGQTVLRLSHPRYKVPKIYQITLSRPPFEDQIEALKKGILIDQKLFIRPDKVLWNPQKPLSVTITLHSGQNRVIRRMVEELGSFVKKLHRISFAGLRIDKLKPGAWKEVSKEIINKILARQN